MLGKPTPATGSCELRWEALSPEWEQHKRRDEAQELEAHGMLASTVAAAAFGGMA